MVAVCRVCGKLWVFVPPKLLLCQLSKAVHHSIVGAPGPHHIHFHIQITYLYIDIVCIYIHMYIPICIFSRNTYIEYIYIFTIVYFPGIPPKQAKFASGLVVQLDCKGKTWLRIFFGNLPPKPSNWMVGTTEN